MRGGIARGAAWMVLLRLFDRSLGLISTTVLARLLVPADFGLVAMAMSVIAVIELATAFSFEIALIQKPAPEREHFDTAWTLNIIIAMLGALVTVALARPAASFYGAPRLGPVMWAIAGAWLISGFENTGTVNFRREMNFSAEFRWMASKRVLSFVATMIAAFTFRSYWALVIGMATSRIGGVVISYVVQPFRPRLSLSTARELVGFSGWMLANNMAIVVFSRLPQIYVGRVLGAKTLGAYAVSSEIAQMVHTELVAPINRSMFPGYARLAHDADAFRRVCVEATAVILLIVLPVSAAVAVLAGPMVRVLLGEQWGEAVPIIRVLAFSGAIAALNSNNLSAYIALGRPHIPTIFLAARVLIFAAILMALSSTPSAVAVASAELVASLGSLLVSLPMLLSMLRLTVRDYVATMWRPLIASALGAAAVHTAIDALEQSGSFSIAALELLFGLLLGAMLYPLLLWMLWRVSGRPEGAETSIARRASDLIRRGKRK